MIKINALKPYPFKPPVHPRMFKPGASTLITGLQFYYNLSDVNDSSGNSLTLTNQNTTTFVSGKVGNCANFVAASTQTLFHATDSHYAPALGSYTAACWVNWTAASPPYGILNCGQFNGAGGGWVVQAHTDNKILARIGDGTTDHFLWDTGSTYNNGNWHLIVVTFDRASNITLYIDNVSVGTPVSITDVTGNITGTAANFTIGLNGNFGNYMDGKIDEAGGWNRVLGTTEISNLYNGNAGTTYPFTGL